MSERKNIKRNKKRITNEQYKQYGRKGQVKMNLTFPNDPYLQKLVKMGLL